MIVDSIFQLIIAVSRSLGLLLPSVTSLPWGLDSIFQQAVSGFKGFMAIFPPLQTVFNAFLIYLGFRIALRIVKAVPFLGRTVE